MCIRDRFNRKPERWKRWHAGRRWFIKTACENNGEYTVARLVGHSDVRTTRKYLQNTVRDQDKCDAINSIGIKLERVVTE